MEQSKPFYIRLPNQLRQSLQDAAIEERRSLTAQIVVVLEEWVAEHRKEPAGVS